jgi:hypothetical protein
MNRNQGQDHVPGWLTRHPFLTLGAISFLAFLPLLLLDLDPESTGFRILAAVWRTAGFGPHLTANLLARHAPWLPAWLDAGAVVVLGLLPYALLDAALRRVRRR